MIWVSSVHLQQTIPRFSVRLIRHTSYTVHGLNGVLCLSLFAFVCHLCKKNQTYQKVQTEIPWHMARIILRVNPICQINKGEDNHKTIYLTQRLQCRPVCLLNRNTMRSTKKYLSRIYNSHKRFWMIINTKSFFWKFALYKWYNWFRLMMFKWNIT